MKKYFLRIHEANKPVVEKTLTQEQYEDAHENLDAGCKESGVITKNEKKFIRGYMFLSTWYELGYGVA